MRRPKHIALIVTLAMITNCASCAVQGTYQGAVGNLCGESRAETCYEALPTGEFPITYGWDVGGVSVVGSLSIVEDRFSLWFFLLNFAVYVAVFSGLFLMVSLWKRRKNTKAT